MRFVRHGDFKLIIPEPDNYDGGLELYNLAEDPDELHNLAELQEYQDKIDELKKLADEWWTPGDDSAVAKPLQE
jgi:arylsulfatase A-like enzyme